MTNVLEFPRPQQNHKKVTVDVFDELIKQTYPNPIIYDLYWIMELIQRVRSDVVNLGTWFDETTDDVCYFKLDLDNGAFVVIQCEGVESVERIDDGISYLRTHYKPKNDSCYESVKLQLASADIPCTWTEAENTTVFSFPQHNTKITVTLDKSLSF